MSNQTTSKEPALNWWLIRGIFKTKLVSVSYFALLGIPLILSVAKLLHRNDLPETFFWVFMSSLMVLIAWLIYFKECPLQIKKTGREQYLQEQKSSKNELAMGDKIGIVYTHIPQSLEVKVRPEIEKKEQAIAAETDPARKKELEAELLAFVTPMYEVSLQNHIYKEWENYNIARSKALRACAIFIILALMIAAYLFINRIYIVVTYYFFPQ